MSTLLDHPYNNFEAADEMLLDLIRYYDGNAAVYYFDLPFEKAVERHHTQTLSDSFGEDSLQSWRRAGNYLGVEDEKMLTEEMAEEDIMDFMCSHVEVN